MEPWDYGVFILDLCLHNTMLGTRVRVHQAWNGWVCAVSTSSYTVFNPERGVKIVPKQHVRRADWTPDVGDAVDVRIYHAWYPCHVHAVGERLTLQPVFTHVLFDVPVSRCRKAYFQLPQWTARVYPSHVINLNTVFACYGVTQDHYIVDTQQGRAYLPKQVCQPYTHDYPEPKLLGSIEEPCEFPAVVTDQLHHESLLDLLTYSSLHNDSNALRVMDRDRHHTHTYRHWCAGSVALQLEMCLQLNDAQYVQELIDITSSYSVANRSQRLVHALAARELVTLRARRSGSNVTFDIFWNGLHPRPHTMLVARQVFRRITTTERVAPAVIEPYGGNMHHKFLHDFQTQTLVNMIELENSNIAELFTYKTNEHKCNDYTGVSAPVWSHGGGYLSADVGLGKTVMMIALMLTHPVHTLVVAPPSLLQQWKDECHKYGIMATVWHTKKREVVTVRHVKRLARVSAVGCPALTRTMAQFYALNNLNTTCNALRKVRVKHRKCHLRACAMAERHCVITTPSFFRRNWKEFLHISRVVIDEAHLFKSSNTLTVRGIHDLAPAYLWCITATPPPPLLQAQLLNIYPGTRIQNLSAKDKALVETVTLRLSRDVLETRGLLDTLEVEEITLHCDPTHAYAKQYLKYRGIAFQGVGTKELKRMLDDLEKMCVHTSCVPLHRYGTRIDVDKTTMDNVVETFGFDANAVARVKETIANMDTCALCLESYERPTITSCGHVFCRDCVTQLKKHTNKCPHCRQPVNNYLELVDQTDDVHRVTHGGVLYQVPKLVEEEGDKVQTIRTLIAKGNTVVCSKHTSVIRYLQKELGAPAITGKSSPEQRTKALETFHQEGVLLITERSAGVGLCLQKANTLVFVEKNMQNRQQVLGRIKRLGQRRKIKVYTLVAMDSVEERYALDPDHIFGPAAHVEPISVSI